MIGDLLINGKDAFATWGVSMGKGFIDALHELPGKKEYITNDNRLVDGVGYCSVIPKSNQRQVTLTFTIIGISPADFSSKRDAFFNELDKGDVSISVPQDCPSVYHLKFMDSTGSYGQNTQRTFCKVGVKFVETNPKNRA